jgi:hypothetical protein
LRSCQALFAPIHVEYCFIVQDNYLAHPDQLPSWQNVVAIVQLVAPSLHILRVYCHRPLMVPGQLGLVGLAK